MFLSSTTHIIASENGDDPILEHRIAAARLRARADAAFEETPSLPERLRAGVRVSRSR